jgi:hypothetical protein
MAAEDQARHRGSMPGRGTGWIRHSRSDQCSNCQLGSGECGVLNVDGPI